MENTIIKEWKKAKGVEELLRMRSRLQKMKMNLKGDGSTETIMENWDGAKNVDYYIKRIEERIKYLEKMGYSLDTIAPPPAAAAKEAAAADKQ